MSRKYEEVRKKAEADLYAFAVLTNPSRLYGQIHKQVFKFLSRGDTEQLVLLPRGHQKSHCIAVWCSWWITKHPDTTILYTSATEDLAVAQLYAIKNILQSDVYRTYWPNMVDPDEAKREQWNVKNIKVDHPIRKEMGVRDATVAARSIDGNTTGLHCDVLILDDIVVPSNAYTKEGRQSVKAGYSQFASVMNTGAIEKAVGTRYHGQDVYGMMIETEVEEYNDEGEVVGSRAMYSVFEQQVEDEGNFCWPRQQHPKTKKWYGFDVKELNKIRSKYIAAGERIQFYAQYYNNPNAGGSEDITSDKFQYYDRKYLEQRDGDWYFKNKKLAIYAGGDLAYTQTDTSDYTALAVVGLDDEGFIYILELDQFRTNKYGRIYDAIERLYRKWGFRKIRLESNAGANMIAEHCKDEVRRNGLTLVVEGKPAKGDKIERFGAILEPRYTNSTIWHYTGGVINELEEQIILPRPAHDDLRDAMCIAVEISKPASRTRSSVDSNNSKVVSMRFGGRPRR